MTIAVLPVRPGTHVLRFFLDPTHGCLGRIGLQCLYQYFIRERIELFDSDNGDVETAPRVAGFDQVVIHLTAG